MTDDYNTPNQRLSPFEEWVLEHVTDIEHNRCFHIEQKVWKRCRQELFSSYDEKDIQVLKEAIGTFIQAKYIRLIVPKELGWDAAVHVDETKDAVRHEIKWFNPKQEEITTRYQLERLEEFVTDELAKIANVGAPQQDRSITRPVGFDDWAYDTTTPVGSPLGHTAIDTSAHLLLNHHEFFNQHFLASDDRTAVRQLQEMTHRLVQATYLKEKAPFRLTVSACANYSQAVSEFRTFIASASIYNDSKDGLIENKGQVDKVFNDAIKFIAGELQDLEKKSEAKRVR